MVNERERIELLERSLLDLGTELFQLKGDLKALRVSNDQFIETLKGLKFILDDKGLINSDDFDSAVAFKDAVSSPNQPFDPSYDFEMEKIKKSSH